MTREEIKGLDRSKIQSMQMTSGATILISHEKENIDNRHSIFCCCLCAAVFISTSAGPGRHLAGFRFLIMRHITWTGNALLTQQMTPGNLGIY